jgi:hypothetical protein
MTDHSTHFYVADYLQPKLTVKVLADSAEEGQYDIRFRQYLHRHESTFENTFRTCVLSAFSLSDYTNCDGSNLAYTFNAASTDSLSTVDVS